MHYAMNYVQGVGVINKGKQCWTDHLSESGLADFILYSYTFIATDSDSLTGFSGKGGLFYEPD